MLRTPRRRREPGCGAHRPESVLPVAPLPVALASRQMGARVRIPASQVIRGELHAGSALSQGKQ